MLGERETDDTIYFWGGIFSQWYGAHFKEDDVTYTSNEQYMMAKKAETFNDKESYETIMETNSPLKQKAIGRKVKNYIDKVWADKRYDVVVQANYLKFTQNQDLKTLLLEDTNGREIVEASHEDPIWGIGLAPHDDRVLDKSKWKGQNLLGKAIMDVRTKLEQEK